MHGDQRQSEPMLCTFWHFKKWLIFSWYNPQLVLHHVHDFSSNFASKFPVKLMKQLPQNNVVYELVAGLHKFFVQLRTGLPHIAVLFNQLSSQGTSQAWRAKGHSKHLGLFQLPSLTNTCVLWYEVAWEIDVFGTRIGTAGCGRIVYFITACRGSLMMSLSSTFLPALIAR